MDFDTLYERYARDVYCFALYLSRRPHEADDITAETFWHTRFILHGGLPKHVR